MGVNAVTSGLTLEQQQFHDLTRIFIQSSINSLELFRFIKSPDVFTLLPVPSKLANAKKVADLEVSKGTVGPRNSDGDTTGNDFKEVDRYENLGGMENISGTFTVAWQDRNLLTTPMQTLLLIYGDFVQGAIDITTFNKRIAVTEYGKNIISTIIEKIQKDAGQKLTDFIKASKTALIFDTEAFFKSTAGALYANVNIIAAEFSEVSLATMLNLQAKEVNQNGTLVGVRKIKHMLVSPDKTASFIQITQPNNVVDSENRSLYSFMGQTAETMVIMPLDTLDAVALLDNHGLAALCEFPEINVKIKEIDNFSTRIDADFNIGFMWMHGNGGYYFDKQ